MGKWILLVLILIGVGAEQLWYKVVRDPLKRLYTRVTESGWWKRYIIMDYPYDDPENGRW